MKKILIATDFSANALNAANFGYNLAKDTKSQLLLFNGMTIPAEIPQAGFVTWPEYESETLKQDSTEALKQLKKQLHDDDTIGTFMPEIGYINQEGLLAYSLNNNIAKYDIDFVIAATHGGDELQTLMIGNHCRQIIESTVKPLILVPPAAKYHGLKKIAFTSDFEQPLQDIAAIRMLLPLAQELKSEVLLTHIYDDTKHTNTFKAGIERMLTELAQSINYKRISINSINNRHVEEGLDKLIHTDKAELLAMVHKRHNLLSDLLIGSHTQKMARRIQIPLLVFKPII